MKLGILTNFCEDYYNYIEACKELKVEYKVIDITSTNWIKNIQEADCDGFLVRPNHVKQVWKSMDDEKLYFIEKILNKKIYPSYLECFIYENKKNMSYWLDINNVNHAKTYVFYKKDEALDFLKKTKYPLVFKPNIASAGTGIKFIENKKQGIALANKIFTKFKFINFGYTKWIKTKYGISYPQLDDKQFNFMIIQEKINVKYEWRIIKIGESYFGHQKLEKNGLHSGSGEVGWENPSKDLLNLVKKICEIGNFSSMAVDIFEDTEGKYFVNELQTIFGSYNPSQMYINGRPGRYRYINNSWKFEEGYFNQNYSCNLRVKDFINQLSRRDENI